MAQGLARGLVQDAGPTLDREARMFPAEEFAGEVGIQQTLVEEQGDDAVAPYFAEGRGGPEGAVQWPALGEEHA